MTSHLLSLNDLDAHSIRAWVDLAVALKKEYKAQGPRQDLLGKTVALYFEKPSLRTIITFQVGVNQLGGQTVIVDPVTTGIGKREPLEDVMRCLSRWVDALVVRSFEQSFVENLAKAGSIPVINALTDSFHPCQALAFAQTLLEHTGSLQGHRVAFIGDGNNVANSLALLCAKLGMHFTLACPKGFEQPVFVQEILARENAISGGSYTQTYSPAEAARTADVLYSDVWVSMGEESKSGTKISAFDGFQINNQLLASAPAHCLVTHCLPAHRGEEITAEIMEHSRNVCFDEAENRLHAQKAVMLKLIGNSL
jgi:ornithine carbamoyltransferase